MSAILALVGVEGGRVQAVGPVAPTFTDVLLAHGGKRPPALATEAPCPLEPGKVCLPAKGIQPGRRGRAQCTSPKLTLEVDNLGFQGDWGGEVLGLDQNRESWDPPQPDVPPTPRVRQAQLAMGVCALASLPPSPRTLAHALSPTLLLTSPFQALLFRESVSLKGFWGRHWPKPKDESPCGQLSACDRGAMAGEGHSLHLCTPPPSPATPPTPHP